MVIMKKKMNSKMTSLFMVIVIVIASVFGGVPTSIVANAVTMEKNLKGYSIPTYNIPAYRDSNLTQRDGTVYPSDEIYISLSNRTSKSILIEYNITGTNNYKCRWVDINYILTSTLVKKTPCNSYVTVYKRPGGAKYGTIYPNDVCMVSKESSGAYVQVIYPIGNNKYKAGFISSNDLRCFPGYPKNNSGNTGSNSSTVEYPLRNARCSWRGYNNSTWSWSENRYGSGHTNERVYHLGLDLTGDSTVYSCANGTVVACSNSNSGANGRYVIVQHSINGKKCYSFYAHLSSVSVKNGQSVNNQTKLGVIGGSGYGKNNYYGTHLHFAIVNTLWSNGSYYGYSTKFSGNSRTYNNVTYYNPKYVVEHNALP